MGSPVEAWLRAFLLTCAVELPLVVALTRDSALDWRRRAVLAFFAQLATHPTVWYVFPAIPGLAPITALVLSELWAWFGEAGFYVAAGVARTPVAALGVAAIANGASLGFALAVRT
jgi:hypothetical protein